MMLPKTAIELRKTIRSFGGERFNTTELRGKREFSNLLSELHKMAESGELKYIGRARHNTAWVDVWQELRLNTVMYSIDDHELDAEVLPGWREAFPALFADIVHPWMPVKGVISNFAEM